MPTNRPCSDPPRLVAIEGMPAAGKTTLADRLAADGHTVIGEYIEHNGQLIDVQRHPAVSENDAHQANWLRKHQHALRIDAPVVYLDRDWLTALAYAYSVDDDQMLATRSHWALGHLNSGTLRVASAYIILRIDPHESLRRRGERLDPHHPWSTLQALQRLCDFYRAPAALLATHSTALADRLAEPQWTFVEAPTRAQARDAALDLVGSR